MVTVSVMTVRIVIIIIASDLGTIWVRSGYDLGTIWEGGRLHGDSQKQDRS